MIASVGELAERLAKEASLTQRIGMVSLVVRDYDEAINFYVGNLDFQLVEDTFLPEQGKRWVVVRPRGGSGPDLLLAKATTPNQCARIGDQTGGRVAFFLHTDDFWRDYRLFRERGVSFIREVREEAYGTVSVFEDLYGNRWDLIQPTAPR